MKRVITIVVMTFVISGLVTCLAFGLYSLLGGPKTIKEAKLRTATYLSTPALLYDTVQQTPSKTVLDGVGVHLQSCDTSIVTSKGQTTIVVTCFYSVEKK